VILDGIRILAFTTGIAGPNAGRILASLGAEVIKVESRAGGVDAFRYFGVGDDLNSSARFAEANLGVRSLAVNLKHPDGLAVIRSLAARCDVVLENYRPGVLDRLGLSYAALREVRPDVIVVRMPGLGSTGPMRGYGTWGALLTAYSGLTALWNHQGATRPIGNQGVFPDYLSSVLAPMVVVSALLNRERTGSGCVIDLAQSEATAFCALPVSMLEVSVTGADPTPIGNRTREPAVQGVYPCLGSDRWCAIRLDTDEELRAILAIVGADSDLTRRFQTIEQAIVGHDEIDGLLSAWTLAHDPRAVMVALQEHGIAAGLVASGLDLLSDPQLDRAGFIRHYEQPGVGEMIIPGLPLETEPSMLEAPGPAAALGEDTESVLREIVGLDDASYSQLDDAGVLR
jgi:crotonobetainyl-CoA:carnitine CoA-transferase CaiB-like acyl-CoA transferase